VVAIRWDGKESGPTDSYVISPPAGSPTAAECDVPPRTAPPAPLDGTPVPPPIAASRVLQDTRLWLEQAELPTGEPASAEEVAGIIATIRELSACEARATDPGAAIDTVQDSRARQFALFTDDYLRRHLDPVQEPSPGPGTPTPPWWGAYWYSAAWSPGPEMPEIQEVLRLPNGRIGALVDSGRFGDRDFLVFVHVGDRWLIDEVAMVAPGVTTAGTPSIEERARSGPALALIMDDISFAPSRFGIPPNMDVALTLANVGKVPHTFNVDYLDIHLEVQPGEATTIVIKASTGTYDFYCSIPGHKEAGMVGSMFVAPAYQLPGSSGGAGDGDAGTLEVFGGSVVEGESATPNP
jgi:plastocyanin